MIDVAHDGDDGRARQQVLRIVRDVEQAFLDVGFGNAAHRMAHLLGDELCGVGVDDVGDHRHVALLHHQPDDVHSALRHAVGELLDRDGFRNGDFADELFLGLVGGMALEPLNAPAERSIGALAHLVGAVRRHQREAAALFLGGRPRGGPRGDNRTGGTTGAAPHRARRLVLFGFERGPCCRRCGPRLGFLAAETLLGDLVGLALGFLVVLAAIFFLVLARFGGDTLLLLALLAFAAPARFLLGDLALLSLAHPRIRQRMGPRLALLLGQCTQHDARRLRRRCGGSFGRRDRRHAWNGTPRGRSRLGMDRFRPCAFAADAPLHLLDHHRLAAAMAEALPDHARFGARLDRQGLRRGDFQRLLGRGLGIGFAHYRSSSTRRLGQASSRTTP